MKFLGYGEQVDAAIMGDFSIDDTIDSSLNIVGRIGITLNEDVSSFKMLIAVVGGGDVGRALGSD